MNEDLVNLSKDQLFHLVHWRNTFQTPKESKREFINSVRKSYQNLSRIFFDRGRNLERRHSDF